MSLTSTTQNNKGNATKDSVKEKRSATKMQKNNEIKSNRIRRIEENDRTRNDFEGDTDTKMYAAKALQRQHGTRTTGTHSTKKM